VASDRVDGSLLSLRTTVLSTTRDRPDLLIEIACRGDRVLPINRHIQSLANAFNTRAYRFRAQVETVMSMLKRNLGAALSAKTSQGRWRELMLRVLTHNIMIALIGVFYRAVMSPFPSPSRLSRISRLVRGR
jgi:hypothetical protein